MEGRLPPTTTITTAHISSIIDVAAVVIDDVIGEEGILVYWDSSSEG